MTEPVTEPVTGPVTKARTRVVVLFGGRSAEHEVSCTSAVSVLGSLDPDRYDIVAVGVTRDGDWVRSESAEALVRRSAAGEIGQAPRLEATGTAVDRSALLAGGHVSASDAVAGRVVVLPILHGPFVEDGTVQGMLELADVPYVGSGVLGSAVGMDKAIAKSVLATAGIPQARWLARAVWELATPAAVDAFSELVAGVLVFPVFVKPANMGSSVGITKAHDHEEFISALDIASAFDDWVVVEESIAGREIEFAVLGNEHPEVSVAGEILPGKEFYDYEDKYLGDAARLVIPAALSTEELAAGQHLALQTFRALRAEGMARVDFFYDDRPGGAGWLVNEINTIPGFTPISMYPKLWEASGVPYPQLLDRLIGLAVARHARRSTRVGRSR